MNNDLAYTIKIILVVIFMVLLINKFVYLYDDIYNNEGFEGDNQIETFFMTGNSSLQTKQEVYTELLKRASDVLDEMNISWFLSSGTCLGYFREGKFIDHDYDIDIGIFAEDYTDEIIRRLTKKGIILYRVLGDPVNGMELSFVMPGTKLKRRAKIDIFLHYITPDKKNIFWITYKAPEFTDKIKYQVPMFSIKKTEFVGLDVGVPDDTLTYIESHYGNDWNIPKKPGKGYFYATSPVSIVKD